MVITKTSVQSISQSFRLVDLENQFFKFCAFADITTTLIWVL